MASQQVPQVPHGGQAQAEREQKQQEGVSWAERVKGIMEKGSTEERPTERKSTAETSESKSVEEERAKQAKEHHAVASAKRAGEHQAAASTKREEAKKEAQQAGSQVTRTTKKAGEATVEKGHQLTEKAKEGLASGTETVTKKSEELTERAKESLGETAEMLKSSFGKGQEEVQEGETGIGKGVDVKGKEEAAAVLEASSKRLGQLAEVMKEKGLEAEHVVEGSASKIYSDIKHAMEKLSFVGEEGKTGGDVELKGAEETGEGVKAAAADVHEAVKTTQGVTQTVVVGAAEVLIAAGDAVTDAAKALGSSLQSLVQSYEKGAAPSTSADKSVPTSTTTKTEEQKESGAGPETQWRSEMAATQESVCRRCRTLFKREENSQEACRFHPKMFVSRKHDDQKRYYELKDGDPEYPARFYDCCGAEDPSAPGCTTACHVSYDD
ncbi:unnamed protein product [Closterium sp. NIES-65]|nr:unnamed protein product [Closterium sp. NIES-65]